MQFSDRDIMLDLLLGTKSISTRYHMGVLESANDRVRNTLIQLNNDEINLQKQMFNLMHDRNWYPVRAAGTATWQTAGAGMATGVEQQMPY